MAVTDQDRAHLERAAELGQRGWGRVHPNPLVGCVVVTEEGEVAAEAWHEEWGGPHAEASALRSAGPEAEGGTAYVSLEPCRHHGKTPPCTEALATAQVGRVVYGASDPTTPARGGASWLRDAGIEVDGPVFGPERAHRENPAFFHAALRGTPYVALKLAASLDGFIAAAPGARTELTGPEARVEVHRLRAGFDAALIGSGTALVDDPMLTVRESVPSRKPPVRIVLDSGARLSPTAALFEAVDTAPVMVFVRDNAPGRALSSLREAGASVHPVSATGRVGLDLREVLRVCWDEGVRSILCEGGSRVAASLLEDELISRLYLLLAPRILGAGGVPAFDGSSVVPNGAWTVVSDPLILGGDVLITYDRLESDPEREKNA